MKLTQVALALALFFSALVLLTFGGTNLVAAPVWLIFRRGTTLETVYTIAQVAAFAAMAILFIVGAMVAVLTALQPAPSWFRKSLLVLPAYLLAVTVATLLANILGIATLGSITDPQSIKVSLATALLVASAVPCTLAVTIAASRTYLSHRVLKAALVVTAIAIVPGLILSLAMLGGVNIVMTSPVPGDSEGIASLITQFQIGSGLITAFTVIAAISAGLAVRAWRKSAATIVPSAPSDFRREAGHAVVSSIAISVIILLAIQLVPVSRDNPPVLSSVQWDSPQTKDLVYRACMNCHSNETAWPWYATFAPGSWITSVHVNSARQQFNLSDVNKLPSIRRTRLARDMADQIRNSIMPPIDYQFLHPESRLTAAEKEQLIQGLQNSLK